LLKYNNCQLADVQIKPQTLENMYMQANKNDNYISKSLHFKI
jgi:hypothetical protein